MTQNTTFLYKYMFVYAHMRECAVSLGMFATAWVMDFSHPPF